MKTFAMNSQQKLKLIKGTIEQQTEKYEASMSE